MVVPEDVRETVGRRVWRSYISVRPESEAKLIALQLAIDRQREIRGIRAGSAPEEEPSIRAVTSISDRTTSGDLTLLVEVWIKTTRPRAKRSIDRMRKCISDFIELIGPVAPSNVTREHVCRFRDDIESKGLRPVSARDYLDALHRLFAVAVSEGIICSNPANGIRLRANGKFSARSRRQAFDPEQVRSIFALLSHESEPFRWIVKLLAYHGFRSGEVTQLRKEDVVASFGINIIKINDRFGTLKNAYSQREVPLHPACSEFFEFARATPGPWVFPQDCWRADRFQRYASDFLRNTAEIADPAFTMHSFRHTWRTLAREIDMPFSVSRAIMGHSLGRDAHETYGHAPSLRLKSKWIERIDPLDALGGDEREMSLSRDARNANLR